MIKYLTFLIFFFPHVGLAAEILDLLAGFVELGNILVAFLISLSTLVFLWGVLTYVIHGDSETKKTEARGYMLYGIITLFVMVSVWSLSALLSNTFGITKGLNLPDKKGEGGSSSIFEWSEFELSEGQQDWRYTNYKVNEGYIISEGGEEGLD